MPWLAKKFFASSALARVRSSNFCPPRPGYTLITSSISASSMLRNSPRSGGVRADGDARAHAEGADVAQDGAQVLAARLGMDGDDVRARADKVLRLDERVDAHEMYVQRQGGMAADRRDHIRAEGDLGDEAPVHHVAMDEVGAAAFQLFDRRPHLRKVRRQNGRSHAYLLHFFAIPPRRPPFPAGRLHSYCINIAECAPFVKGYGGRGAVSLPRKKFPPPSVRRAAYRSQKKSSGASFFGEAALSKSAKRRVIPRFCGILRAGE